MSSAELGLATSNKFSGLDELRGYAAVIVLLFHASARIGQPFLSGGYLAVDLFFLISGFVIAHAYDKRLPDLGVIAFLRLRLIRLYPLYLLGTCIGALLAAIWLGYGKHTTFNPGDLIAAIAYALLFLPALGNKIDGSPFPLDIPAWSLLFEIIINAAYAAFFSYLSRTVIVVVTLTSGLALVYLNTHPGIIDDVSGTGLYYSGLARVGFSFPLGVLMYRKRHLFPDFAKLGVATAPLLFVCLWGAQDAARDLIFIMLVSPLLLMIAAQSKPIWPRLATYLAETSYCIYIIHHPILMMVNGTANRLGVSSVVPIGIAIVAILVGSHYLDKYYDRPVRNWLSSRFAGTAASRT